MKTFSDYAPYRSDDFLTDEAFREWILRPSPEMDAYWQGLLNHYPHLRPEFETAKLLAQGLVVSWIPFSATYTGQLYERIRPHLTDNVTTDFDSTPVHRIGGWWRYAAAAAVVVLVVGLGLNRYFFSPITYRTAYAQTKTFTLYDGSKVTLNANSVLRVPSRYAWQHERSVWLSGEGYFVVQKQPKPGGLKKFSVQTSQLSVEVLGTQFNVYARSQRTSVLLNEGAVRLVQRAANRPTLLMKPGQVAELSPATPLTKVITASQEQARRLNEWRSNLLVFNDASMTELASRFREVYGLELVLKGDDFRNEQFRGELPVTNVEEALSILSATFERKAVREGNRVYFVSLD